MTVKSVHCSSRVQEFVSRHPPLEAHSHLKTPVPGDMRSFFIFHRNLHPSVLTQTDIRLKTILKIVVASMLGL